MPEWFLEASAWVIPVVLAITLHEAAHGWMALRFGDDTAQKLGRVTFNPLKHVDPMGTVALPALLFLADSPILFGYAKPVPVSFGHLSPPRRGMFMVAIAGVAVNFALAVASALLLHADRWIPPEAAPWLYMNLYRSLMINCVLIAVNLIPILPLDGGRAVDAFLRGRARTAFRTLERYGIVLVLGVLLLGPLLGLDTARVIIGEPALWLVKQVLWLTGNVQA